MKPVTSPPPVRSFVLRSGRLTAAQKRALATLWGRYGLEGRGVLERRIIFGREAPMFVEVGFGNGDALLEMAEGHPERDYIGIEVHLPGIGRLLAGLHERGLTNVRVVRADAAGVFERGIPDGDLDGVNIWFPDPWPKKRHHKRRLVQPSFVKVVTGKLKPSGCIHLATDWEHYARQMLQVLEGQPGLVNLAGKGEYFTGPTERPVTRFQRRGERMGHGVWDLVFKRA